MRMRLRWIACCWLFMWILSPAVHATGFIVQDGVMDAHLFGQPMSMSGAQEGERDRDGALKALSVELAMSGFHAYDGLMDLRSVELGASEPIALSGGWLFYEAVFLSPDDEGSYEHRVIEAPATWGSQPLQMGDHGYGTYRLSIMLAEKDIGRTLGLYVPPIASAYELYINGIPSASAGTVGISANEMEPAALPQTVYFTADRAEMELLIHVSNFSQRKGGMWKELKLGSAESMAMESRNRLLFQVFIASGLLLMGIFHVGFSFIRSDLPTLFFGITCLLLFLRSVFVGDFLAIQLFPDIPWEAAVKMEYISVFWGISFLVLYFDRLYEHNLDRKIGYSLAFAMIGVTLPVLVLPARIYTEWMIFYMGVVLILILYIVYGLVRSVIYRRVGARLNLTVGVLFLATAVNDILYYNFVFKSIDLVALGLFLFIFTQMFMLAKKFALAFREEERLKGELEMTNARLEDVVEERTRELRLSNEKLRRSEQARTDLLNDIIHELRNPLTSIIGYLRRLKDGVDRLAMERHIGVAYRKAEMMDRIVYDLRELALLGEHRDRMAYHVQPVSLADFCEALQQSYDWELLDRQVELQWKISQDDAQLCLHIDLKRIEQAFANLVNNALAHTGTEDRITIIVRYFSFANACAVAVRDSGAGIAEKDRPHLFDRFYRARQQMDGASPVAAGTGLGLTIAKTIVEAHRGRIGMRSELGKGSEFYLILPVGKELP